ncbi:MAG: IS110 family transposase [Candidatus Methylomirabilales bacterium]
MARYYMGVDWADQEHAVWVGDEAGAKIAEMAVAQTAEGLSEFGRWLHERRAAGIELWAAIEKPEGRVVEFLLDHGVVVYPINPKALDRARDRFRMSGAKSDFFDARVLAEFLRTDHPHLQPLVPNSEPAQELKLLTRDYQRQVRQQTRLLNQLTATLKEYYPRPLAVFEDLKTPLARDFLQAYPTPQAVGELTPTQWKKFARAHRLSAARTTEIWATLKAPQLPVPPHVVRAKARLVRGLVEQLGATVRVVAGYREAVEDFFVTLPAAEWARTLPGGKSGTTVPTLWAELGDAPGRWQSVQHLQGQAGAVPVTERSGKQQLVRFRFACNTHLRYAMHTLAFLSLGQSEWALAYYKQHRARGHSHHQAVRALGAKWLKIIFVMWTRQIPYDETYHLATIARQHLRQAA